jgi:hypothetical protein
VSTGHSRRSLAARTCSFYERDGAIDDPRAPVAGEVGSALRDGVNRARAQLRRGDLVKGLARPGADSGGVERLTVGSLGMEIERLSRREVESQMARRVVGTIVSLVCALGCAAAVPAVAGAVLIGIGDGNATTFTDPRFLALHITTARDVVPWDIVTRRADRGDLRNFRAWLQAAETAHVTPLISFGADYRNPAANYIPSVSQYKRAVAAFLKRFPQINDYTAWNEPDFSYRRLARDPALAANYFNVLAGLCHHCTVLAGDVYLPTSGPAYIDHASATLGPWLRAYIRGLHHRPAGWALHDYTEVRGHNSSQIRTLMSMTSGPIWLDETGGVLRRGHWQYRNQSANGAARGEKFLLSLAKRFHRIKRIYHYQWRGNASVGWDSGLIAPNGRPRPAYKVLLNWIRPHRR